MFHIPGYEMENKMKSIPLILLSILTISATSLFLISDLSADGNTCTFKAVAGKVHVTVWDEDSQEDRQGKIFEGWLKPEERHKVTSKTGFIVFSYKLSDDDRSYGDNHRNCKNGNIIRIP